MNKKGALALSLIIIVVVLVIGIGIGIFYSFDGFFNLDPTNDIPEELKDIPDELYCEQDSDCACGVHIDSGDCFRGNKDYTDTTNACPDFCSGISGDMVTKCVNNKCSPALFDPIVDITS